MHCCRTLIAMILGVSLLVGFGADGLAQSTDTGAETETTTDTALLTSNWNLSCTPDSSTQELLCEASQTIAFAESRQTLLIVFVTPWKQANATDPFVLRFQLPHGLDLPQGVQIQIDDESEQSPVIQTSTQVGVYARIGLSERLLASLKKGATMNVVFTAMNGNKFSVPVSLDGFSAIFAKLQ